MELELLNSMHIFSKISTHSFRCVCFWRACDSNHFVSACVCVWSGYSVVIWNLVVGSVRYNTVVTVIGKTQNFIELYIAAAQGRRLQTKHTENAFSYQQLWWLKNVIRTAAYTLWLNNLNWGKFELKIQDKYMRRNSC